MISAVIERCAGIDVGKKFLAVHDGPAPENATAELRKFGTVRAELERLREWLKSEGCTHVVKAGAEETDPHDARWLAHWLRHGMIRPSFIPPRAQRELRDLTRRRKQMVLAAAEERNRVQKVLEDANVKIGDVLSDVFGLSGQRMLEALVAGQSSAGEVAQLARGHAGKGLPNSRRPGRPSDAGFASISDHARHAAHGLSGRRDGSAGLGNRPKHHASGSEPAQPTPANHPRHSHAAAAMLAEGGPNMQQFPGAAHFTSWSGIAPGNHESAGKRRRSPTLRGNPHMKTALVESAWSASRTNGSEFQECYQRLQPRLGHKRAIVAVAHVLALRIYDVLQSGLPYQKARFAQSESSVKRLIRHHSRRLKHLHRWLTDMDS